MRAEMLPQEANCVGRRNHFAVEIGGERLGIRVCDGLGLGCCQAPGNKERIDVLAHGPVDIGMRAVPDG